MRDIIDRVGDGDSLAAGLIYGLKPIGTTAKHWSMLLRQAA